MPNTKEKWAKEVHAALKGRTIKEVRYTTEGEENSMGWHRSGVVLFLDNGDYLLASADDEGNGPGALFTNIKNLEIIPVI